MSSSDYPTLYTSTLSSLPLLGRGKVRDSYTVGEDRLLIVTTDRLSAFDVVFDQPIPGKGVVLNQMSNFWFDHLKSIVPNHLTGVDPQTVVTADEAEQVRGRSVVAKRLNPIPVEAVVRGYIMGSAWTEYQASGTASGIPLPSGLQLAEKLPEPIFTPATKAPPGQHDQNLSFAQMQNMLGREQAQRIYEVSLKLYRAASDYAAQHGMIIADTKFEFGLDAQGVLHLMDEVLTPDSSRFWTVEAYDAALEQGGVPPSFDKQFIRDWLEQQGWSKTPPAPTLPADILQKAAEKYREALHLLTTT